MSMHKIPLTQTEEAGLIAHGLDIGTPSQLSDAFRQGVAWGQKEGREACADVDKDTIIEKELEKPDPIAWLFKKENTGRVIFHKDEFADAIMDGYTMELELYTK